MKKMLYSATIFLIIISCLRVAAAQCSRPPIIFNFGDSNSDTGGSMALLGGPYVYPDGRTYFNRATGRFCDGRLVLDFMCESLHTKFLTPFFEPVEHNFSNGVNFALSGSYLGVEKDNPKTLGVQVAEFSRFHNRSIELSASDLDDLLGEDEFRSALYMIDIGQNSIASGFDRAAALIPFLMELIRDAMKAIYELGGKKFWVHGTGPLGCLPRQLATRNASRSRGGFDKYGCDSDMNEAAKLFNLALDRLCQQLRFEMENSTIVYVDVYSIKYDLIASSSSYGFEDPLMACCGYGGPPYNFHPGIGCRDPGHNLCPAGSPPRINWDGVHYTEAANAIVAAKILSTNYSSPPLPFNSLLEIRSYSTHLRLRLY